MDLAIVAFLNDIKQKCPLITEAELIQFAQGLSVQQLTAREIYRPANVVPTQMGFVVSGLMKGFYTDSNGDVNVIYFGAEGDPVGDYLAFSRQIPSSYTLQTLELTTVVNLSFSHFQASLAQIPHLERYYRLLAEQGFHNFLQRTEALQSDDAESRYLHFIEQNPTLFKRISLSDLSSYLGVQRQSLTRIRKRLAEQR